MSSGACRAAREALTATDLGEGPAPSWAEDHLSECDGCRHWAAAVEDAEGALSDAASETPLLPELSERRLAAAAIDAVMDRDALPPAREPAPRRTWPLVALAAGVAAVLVGGAIVAALVLRDPGRTAAPTETLARSAAGAVALCSGECTVSGQQAAVAAAVEPGQDIEAAPASRLGIALPGGHRVWLHGARAHLESATEDAVVLRLLEGQLVARANGPGLTISTADGEARSLGTIYVVEARSGRLSRVETLEGTVSVRSDEGRHLVVAGQGLVMGGSPEPLEAERRDELLALAGQSSPMGEGATLTVQTTPSGALISVDGVERGNAPLALALGPGSHALSVEAEGLAGVREDLEVTEGDAVRRLYHLERIPAVADAGEPGAPAAVVAATAPEPEGPSARPPVSPRQEPTGPREYYERANELRRSGRHAEAVSVYGELRRRFPGTAAARNATYNIGETNLQALGRPAAALRAFDAYLARPGGAVRQEAMLGRIEALRRLGRSDGERRAIESYLERYPASAAAAGLRRRLGDE